MHHQQPQHQKIRFRRDEISNLSALPSAQGQESHWRSERGRYAWRTLARWVAAGSGVVAMLFLIAIVILVKSDWGTETLRLQAERTIQKLAGDNTSASLGPARITFGSTYPMALKLENLSLQKTDGGVTIANIATLDFGIRFLPLLSGRLQLGGATLSNATISVAALPSMGGGDWTANLRDETGLIDPDLVAVAAFKPLHAAFSAIDTGRLADMTLKNVTVTLAENERVRAITIVDGAFTRTAAEVLKISMNGEVDGRAFKVAGTAQREAGTTRISNVDLSITADALGDEAISQASSAGRLGAIALNIRGSEAQSGNKLKLSAIVEKSVLDFGARGQLAGNIRLDATLEQGSNKLEIDRLLVQTGATSLEFNGAVGPRPPTGTKDAVRLYRYELVSTKTVAAPEGSPEAALDFQSQLTGTFDPTAGILLADDIAVKSGTGEARGNARIELVKGQAPGIALVFALDNVQMAHAKQLWPWFAAGKARSWVFDHVFGGKVQDASIEFRVKPGRLGNGVPLSAEEIVARFALSDTRFDTMGTLPPIRSANGVVDVRGYDVNVKLSSGIIYLPSGRSLTGKNGTLAVAQSNKPPVIGKLDIDVDGDAAAVAEFAAFPPFNAMRFLPFSPDDLSGKVSGHVIADIPLQKGIDAKTLNWMVDLDYDGLSIAKPISGQSLTEASGQLTVEPSQATISTEGLLNGVPATISMIEPLRPEGPRRERDIQLKLDDAARKKIAPGLDPFVTGTMKVKVDDGGDSRKIVADLTDAQLDIPWAGWSKGPGVAAQAEFVMQTTDSGTRLSDFSLTGKSFQVSGDVSLSGGELSSAKLGTVRLNRGDAISVSIARAGKGYKVGIKGSAFDARSVIKTYMSDAKSSDRSSGAKVLLDVDVEQVSGFNGEAITNLKLDSDGNRTSVVATGDTGGAVSFTSGTAAGGRALAMNAADAGAVLRFLDIYKNMQGGSLDLKLTGTKDGGMAGNVEALDFKVVNEPKLASIVSTAPSGSDRSLSQAVKKDIDTSSVSFERGFARINRGDGYLHLTMGVVRGPLIGATFQGTLYDQKGNMDMTGTFMPAYGLNRIVSEIPLVGALLGNGRDRGLIGVTFKLDGDAKSPRLQVNPLSVMAPGIFRQIFEFQLAYAALHQYVLLLAKREFDDTVAIKVCGCDRAAFVLNGLVVQPHRAALDVTARLAVRCRRGRREPEASEGRCRQSSSEPATSIVGSVSASVPSSNVLRAVSAASSAASRPCTMAVASVARTFLASLISEPPSAASRAISSSGRRVKIFRKRSTSASSVLRQYCQKS